MSFNPISEGTFRLQISEAQRNESNKQPEYEGNVKHQGFEKFPPCASFGLSVILILALRDGSKSDRNKKASRGAIPAGGNLENRILDRRNHFKLSISQ